jgi:hypothetical protein
MMGKVKRHGKAFPCILEYYLIILRRLVRHGMHDLDRYRETAF